MILRKAILPEVQNEMGTITPRVDIQLKNRKTNNSHLIIILAEL